MSALTSLSQSALSSDAWLAFGFFAQFIFFMRFVVQWIASERQKRIVVPMAFWYLSMAGALMILIYSIHIRDIVFITAQSLSLFVYVRNVMLQWRIDASDAATLAKVSSEPEKSGIKRTEG